LTNSKNLGAAHCKEPDPVSGNFDDTKYVWYKKKKVCDLDEESAK